LKSQKKTSLSRKDTTSLLVNPTVEVDNPVTAVASSHQPPDINSPIENFSRGTSRVLINGVVFAIWPSDHTPRPRRDRSKKKYIN
jgi:hypothetical protein